MTIGVVATFFDFRNDIRRVIKELARQHKIVILVKPEHHNLIKKYLSDKVEARIIDERKLSVRNRINELLYLFFKRLPETRKNYFLMEEFKIGTLNDKKKEKKATRILQFQKIIPRLYSYDNYLNSLQYSAKTKLDDIDLFLCLTEIYDDYLLARLQRENHKVFIYVYSWDHPCKHVRFTKKAQYLVWNESIKNDLISTQKLEASTIRVTGSTQLGYIYEFNNLDKEEKSSIGDYYYFGCAIGIDKLVAKEIEVIGLIATIIKSTYPNAKLIVRPYPNLNNWNKYKSLENYGNIIIDDAWRQKDLSIGEDAIMNKLNQINNAKAFFHLGTTLGLEACFTNCPSFIVDLEGNKKTNISLHTFIHQYQNEKYIINQSELNTIRSEKQLTEIIANPGNEKYMEFNRKIRNQYPVKSFAALAEEIISLS